jgi:hypothetical protein
MTESGTLVLGLSLVGFGAGRQKVRTALNIKRFRAHFGIGPKAVAAMWKDLKASYAKAKKEDFFLFLNWLKGYDTYHVLAGRWNLDEDTIAKKLLSYSKEIQALKPSKIKFEGFGDEVYIATVDGVHCRINEPRTDASSKWYSHKLNGPGVSYEIAISVRRNNVLWISGPHHASKHDITIFRGGKKDDKNKDRTALYFKIPEGKRVIGDSGYQGEPMKISVSKDEDSKDVKKFFARAKSRQETFNSRVKSFLITDLPFRHGFERHGSAFESVCIAVQYDMENDHGLFEI